MIRPTTRDRLYAACVAAPLRSDVLFWRHYVADNTIENDCVRRCATQPVVVEEVTEADIEWAIGEVEKLWSDSKRSDLPYRVVSMLSDQARTLLHHSGREMVLKVDHDDPGREILRWRYVSLLLPPGILIAAAKRDGLPCPQAVRLLDRSMAPDHPVAHNHVHHAAMMSFEEVWASLQLRALLWPGALITSLRDPRAFCPGLHPGDCPGGRSESEREMAKKRPEERARHMAQWADLIRQAFIGRRILDFHLHHVGALSDCRNPHCVEGKSVLRSLLTGQAFSQKATIARYPWPNHRLGLMRRYREANAPAMLRRSDRPRRELIEELVSEEHRLLARAFVYLRPQESDSSKIDLEYERLFLQYLRVKVAVFKLLVHPPGEQGLKSFLEHFQQIKVYAPESDQVRPRIPDEPGLNIRAVEYRVAPDAWLDTIHHRDDKLDKGPADSADHLDTAWLIHFKRKDSDKNRLPYFGLAVRTLESEADRIVSVLRAKPTHLRELRGIDVCGVEEEQPLWVPAETLRRVRERSREIAGQRPWLRLEPLRLTLHAGEDFTWLTSGLRAVAEPFFWRLIERGDRLGHGIAVTLDPENWWKQKKGKVIRVRKLDRLLDLAFLAEYAKPTPEQNEWLRQEITSAVVELKLLPSAQLGRPAEIDIVKTAKEFWHDLGRAQTRRLMRMPDWDGASANPHLRWIHSLLWKRSVQVEAKERVAIPIEGATPEVALLVEARKRVVHELARWQVCIESNPSSNFIVGGLDAIEARDFLQKRPTGKAPFGEETLIWTISTDDPITFSTTLADEYAYAWAGLMLRDQESYDPSYARALLDEAAATSMRTSFIVPRQEPEIRGRKGRKE